MKNDDFKLLRGFEDGRTNRQTDEQTFVIVESLSRLKIQNILAGPTSGESSCNTLNIDYSTSDYP